MDKETCPICGAKAKPLDRISDADGFECVNDGRFRVSCSVSATTALVAKPKQEWRAALERSRARQPSAWAPMITSYDFSASPPRS